MNNKFIEYFLLSKIREQQSDVLNHNDVTPNFITRAYLTPNGDTRIVIKVDAPSFMQDGPGRYATIANSPVARSFFANSSLKPGKKYTSDNRKS